MTVRNHRIILPFASGLFIATTVDGWRMLRFVAGIAVIVVLAKLIYNEVEDRLAWRGEMRHLRSDVAELIERWSFPGDSAGQIAARLRGMPYSEVGDAVKIMRVEREEFDRRVNRHHGRRAS